METASLDDRHLPEYMALSYCWGGSEVTTNIVVNQCNFKVTANLDSGLRQLRLRRYRCIWVDAISINQADKEERGFQVQLMQRIFSRAALVISWIGSVEDDTAEAVKFLLERSSSTLTLSDSNSGNLREASRSPSRSPRIGIDRRGIHFRNKSPHESPRYSRLEKAKKTWIRNQWSIIQDFFNQDYWKRVWVIQEVAVARNLNVIYGNSEISWDDVAAAIVLWKETLMSLPTAHLSHLYAAQLLDLRNRFTKKSPISLLHAMLVTNKSMATDPRDKLFALLGLAFDGPILVPAPSYADSVEFTMIKLIRAMIVEERSLDILCIRTLYPPANTDPPLWTPPWFANPDFSFWSKPVTILEDRLLSSRSRFQDMPLLNTADPKILVVQGIILDEIYALTSAFGHKSNPLLSECRLSQCDPSNRDTLHRNISNFYPSGPTNALWQALCMDHTFHPYGEPGEYYSARSVAKFRSWFASLWLNENQIDLLRRDQKNWALLGSPELHEWLKENADLQIGPLSFGEWSRRGAPRVHQKPADMIAFYKVLTDILTSSMRLFVTSFGYLGMAPPQARNGDKLCYLRGCSFPVVLRADSAVGYRIVGACSVRTKFEAYAEACVRFAAGKPHLEIEPALNIREINLT